MPKEQQEELTVEEKEKLLSKLEEQGKNKWFKRWQNHMAVPKSINIFSTEKKEQERVLRYLLLRVLINQQARFEKVREMCIQVCEEFSSLLFDKPYEVSESRLFQVFRNVAGQKGASLYKVGMLGGIKPASLFAYRFKAYEGFIRWLEEHNLTLFEVIIKRLKEEGVRGLFSFLSTHQVLEAGWVGSDPKACRMFVNWVVFLLNEIWEQKVAEMTETLMIVDGHVGKVFCRTGLLDTVMYEGRRPFIIQASKMRAKIEKIVHDFHKIPFYVDNGAFYLFEDGYCTDLEPQCGECPVGDICKKHTKWTAYAQHKEN